MITWHCSLVELSRRAPLPVVRQGHETWAVAEPGCEFQVRVDIASPYRGMLLARCSVDGLEVGYHKVLDSTHGHTSCTFEGFLEQQGRGASSTTYRAFRCSPCRPGNGAAVVDRLEEIKAGRVEVQVELAVSIGAAAEGVVQPVLPRGEAEANKLPEGKKWFLAPGLKAEAGSRVASNMSWSSMQFAPLMLLGTQHLRYDSSESLMLRKVLRLDNPAHRAILASSSNARIRGLALERGAASSSAGRAAAGAAAAAAGVKQEGGAGAKRARGCEHDMPRSASAVAVDLTGDAPAKPLEVDGRQLGEDEVAVCDLCCSSSGDEGEGPQAGRPRWKIAKRQVEEVEV